MRCLRQVVSGRGAIVCYPSRLGSTRLVRRLRSLLSSPNPSPFRPHLVPTKKPGAWAALVFYAPNVCAYVDPSGEDLRTLAPALHRLLTQRLTLFQLDHSISLMVPDMTAAYVAYFAHKLIQAGWTFDAVKASFHPQVHANDAVMLHWWRDQFV